MKIAKYLSHDRTIAECLDISWLELVQLFEIQRTNCNPCRKNCASKFTRGWSPVELSKPHRANENVIAISALVLDVDKLHNDRNQFFLQIVDKLPFAYHIHSTHSDEDNSHCYRLVIPYSSPVPARNAFAVRESFLSTFSLSSFVDPATKDLSRFYFLPTRSTSKDLGIFHTEPGPFYSPGTEITEPGLAPFPYLTAQTEPIDLEEAWRILKQTRREESKELIRRINKGEPIALVGERDITLTRIAGVMVGRLQGQLDVDTMLHMLIPSLQATNHEKGIAHITEAARKKLEVKLAWFKQQQEIRAQEKSFQALAVQRFNEELLSFFGETEAEPEETDNVWKQSLHKTTGRNGEEKLSSNMHNWALILRNDPFWCKRFRFNDLKGRIEVLKEKGWEQTQDTLYTTIRLFIEANYQIISPAKSEVRDLIKRIAEETIENPIIDYLNIVQWDKKPRLERFFEEYYGADTKSKAGEDISAYVRRIGINLMVSAVARALEPGCQVDTCIILEGVQGIRKSTSLAALFGKGNVNDNAIDIDTKDGRLAVGSYWAIELAELDSISRKQISSVKQFLTNKSDIVRPPYGETHVEIPRRCVFIGTTNEDCFLQDETGNRRFWPIKVNQVDIEKLKVDKDQLWAEAVCLYKNGERWWFTEEDEAALKQANEETKNRMNNKLIQDKVLEAWIRMKSPSEFTLSELCDWMDISDFSEQQRAEKILGRALKGLGFIDKRKIIPFGNTTRKIRFYSPSPELSSLPQPSSDKLQFKDTNLMDLLNPKGKA